MLLVRKVIQNPKPVVQQKEVQQPIPQSSLGKRNRVSAKQGKTNKSTQKNPVEHDSPVRPKKKRKCSIAQDPIIQEE